MNSVNNYNLESISRRNKNIITIYNIITINSINFCLKWFICLKVFAVKNNGQERFSKEGPNMMMHARYNLHEMMK